MRPRSIVLFETLSLAAVGLGLLVLALTWNALLANVNARIRAAGVEPAMMILAAIYVLVLVMLILLISRRGSVAAKWLFAAIILAETLFTVPGLPAMLRGGIIGWTQILQLVVQLAALWFLFAPQSRGWGRRGAAA